MGTTEEVRILRFIGGIQRPEDGNSQLVHGDSAMAVSNQAQGRILK